MPVDVLILTTSQHLITVLEQNKPTQWSVWQWKQYPHFYQWLFWACISLESVCAHWDRAPLSSPPHQIYLVSVELCSNQTKPITVLSTLPVVNSNVNLRISNFTSLNSKDSKHFSAPLHKPQYDQLKLSWRCHSVIQCRSIKSQFHLHQSQDFHNNPRMLYQQYNSC